MSNQNQNQNLFTANKSTTGKIILAHAQQEELGINVKALEKDRELIDAILEALNLKDEIDLWQQMVFTDMVIDTVEQDLLLRQYHLLLARTVIRSPDAQTSDALRARFYSRAYINGLSERTHLTPEELRVLRSKFVNLVNIHGHVHYPTGLRAIWARMVNWVKRYTKRIPELA